MLKSFSDMFCRLKTYSVREYDIGVITIAH